MQRNRELINSEEIFVLLHKFTYFCVLILLADTIYGALSQVT
jgi:hypothetical protein